MEQQTERKMTIWDYIRHIITMCFVLLCFFFIVGLDKLNVSSWFSLEKVFPGIEILIRTSEVSRFVAYQYNNIVISIRVLLVIAVALFLLSEYQRYINYNWTYARELNIAAILVSLFSSLIFVIEYVVIIGGKFSNKSLVVLFFVWNILLILRLGINLCNRSKVDSTAKVNRKLIIMVSLAGVIISLGCLFIVLLSSGDYIKYRRIMEKQGDALCEDVGYQMGNYASRNCIYANDSIYIVGYEKNDGEATGEFTIYKIDENGNHKVIHTTQALSRTRDCIGYYDGYLYINVTMVDGDNKEHRIIKISEENNTEEVFLSDDKCNYQFAIVDNMMYLYQGGDDEEPMDIMCVNLDEGNELKIYDQNIDRYRFSDNGIWLGRILYNQKNIAYFCYDMCCSNRWYSCERQFYGEYIYNYQHDSESDYIYWDDMLYRSKCSNQEEKEIIDNNVRKFNIYDGNIYYIRAGKQGYELWCAELEALDKHMISEFSYEEHFSSYSPDTYHSCTGLYMGDGYVVCDFGLNDVRERLIVNISDGTVENAIFDSNLQ